MFYVRNVSVIYKNVALRSVHIKCDFTPICRRTKFHLIFDLSTKQLMEIFFMQLELQQFCFLSVVLQGTLSLLSKLPRKVTSKPLAASYSTSLHVQKLHRILCKCTYKETSTAYIIVDLD